MTSALNEAANAAKAWLDNMSVRPVEARGSAADLRRQLGGVVPTIGMPPDAVVRELAEQAMPGLIGSAGGRFFAWVVGSGLESALGADWLVSAWDQNAALFDCSPAAAVIEEIAGEWLKDLLELPREASFAFTTGCQLAHVTALAAARHRLLARLNWDVEQDGIAGAPRIRILASDQVHASLERAARLLGFGRNAIELLETDLSGRVAPSALEAALEKSEAPVLVVLNAGDINVGAFDRFGDLIPLAHEAGAWVHIDGAFGLLARVSRRYRSLLDGVELADSWATDAHKWLNVPFDCGVALVRHSAAHRAAMTVAASYIKPASGMRDQIDWNPEWSRRARGVPVYAAIRELGREGLEALVDRCCGHCRELVEGIGSLEHAEVLALPTLNQGLVRFVRRGASEEDNDAFTDETIAKINASGDAFFSGATWRGRRVMRVSVVSWRTTDDDVRRAIKAAKSALASPLGAG